MRVVIGVLCFAAAAFCADLCVVAPAGVAVAWPYVSGQGPVGRDGKIAPGFDAQMNLGVRMPTVDGQVRMTMRNLLDGLEETGLKFENVVATNVYLDDMNDFAKMNRVYAQYFPDPKPTRTTVSQAPPRQEHGQAKKADVYPSLGQISLIAVR